MVQPIRAFWAFELPGPVVEAITRLQTELARHFPDLKWVHPANLHLTLHFLGDIHPHIVENMLHKFAPLLKETRAPLLALGKIGAFPRFSEPRVVWVSLTGNQKSLQKIYLDTRMILENLGFAIPVTKPYTPHITLARIKTSLKANLPGLEKIKDYPLPPLPNFYLSKLTLYASKLTPAGPIYTSLYSYDLK